MYSKLSPNLQSLKGQLDAQVRVKGGLPKTRSDPHLRIKHESLTQSRLHLNAGYRVPASLLGTPQSQGS